MNSLTRLLALTTSVLTALVMLGALAFVIWSWAFSAGAAAQGVNVAITELNCNSDPEIVVVTNRGATPVDMTGWNLQSDPTTSESLPLQQFGSLSAGETLTVQSGPSAQGPFVWSKSEIFRNNDPTDFAQLASDAGQILLRVNCPAAAQQTAAATAAPTAAPTIAATQAPTPAATALAAASAPNGGGPPDVGATVPPGLLIAVGSGLLSAGLGMFSLPFRGRRRSHASPMTLTNHEPPTAEVGLLPSVSAPERASVRKRSRGAQATSDPYIFLVVIGLALLATLLFLLQFGDQKRE